MLLAAGRRAGWGGAERKWMAQAARCRLWQGARARAVGMWEAGMAQGGVSRGVCAGVVGVTLRAEGGFAGGVGAGRAAAWLCRCTDRGYADADERSMLLL